MTADLIAVGILVAVFAIAAIRDVHLGIATFPAACAVGLFMADMSLDDIFAGFPVGILTLLVGVTYFFGIAGVNGTIDRLVEKALMKVGDRAVLIPLVFFLLTMAISAMGSPLAGLVMAPVGMPLAKRFKIDPMLMALGIGCGLSAGGFAPTSLFGIVTYGTAHDNDIDLSPMLLFAIAILANLVLLAVAYVIFGGRELIRGGPSAGATTRAADVATTNSTKLGSAKPHSASAPTDDTAGDDEKYIIDDDTGKRVALQATRGDGTLTGMHWLTIGMMVALISVVVVLSLTGHDPDIGVLCFAFAAVLAFINPVDGKKAVSHIDWTTVMLVGGIVTFVGVLQTMGAVDTLGDIAAKAGAPMVAATIILVIGGLVSAFASTTGILAALVPLAIPLVASQSVPGWALIAALGVCSSIVDVSPFSTVGATLSATASTEARPRVTKMLTRWGLSMIVIGPIVMMLALVLPASI